MYSWKLLQLQLLIIFLMTPASVFSKPADDQHSKEDYQNDDVLDDMDYGGESEQRDSGNSLDSKQSNLGPVAFRSKDYIQDYQPGNNVTLKCDVVNYDDKKHEIIWYKGDKTRTISAGTQKFDHRISVTKDNSLIINNATESDAGVYLCNVQTEDITLNVKLQVMRSLSANIFIGNRDVTDRSNTYKQGDRIEIECKAFGTHASNVKFRWSVDRNPITSDEHIVVNGGHLIINEANKYHVGSYGCLADDGSERPGNATVNINISYVPYVTVHRSVINTREGNTAHLYCHYQTTLESTVMWVNNGGYQIIANDHSKYEVLYNASDKNEPLHRSILVVKNVNQNDLGKYVCKVQNVMGAEDVNIQLTYKPEPPKLNATKQEGGSVITHWHIRSVQQLTKVSLEYRKKDISLLNILNETDWEVQKSVDREQSKHQSGLWRIKHNMALAPGHWNIRVKAKNEIGWSEYSTDEDIIVHEESPNSAMALASSCAAFGLSIILSIYSINFSTRLFG